MIVEENPHCHSFREKPQIYRIPVYIIVPVSVVIVYIDKQTVVTFVVYLDGSWSPRPPNVRLTNGKLCL